jgi:hypothetical protein
MAGLHQNRFTLAFRFGGGGGELSGGGQSRALKEFTASHD